MISISVYLLFVAIFLAGYLFIIMYKSNKLISLHQQFPVALDTGQVISFVIGILLYLVFPFTFSVCAVITMWVGAFIGIVFCSISGSHLRSSGFFCGGLAAIMGTMVGASAINPAICGLPLSKLPIQNPELAVGTLGLALLVATVFLVKSSLKNPL